MTNSQHLAEQTTLEEDEFSNQYVTFRLAGESFGFPMASVLEIIRYPTNIVEMPLTPDALSGVANLRGSLLPVIDLRRLFDLSQDSVNESTRVIVVDAGTPLGFVVDQVLRVVAIEENDIETSDKIESSIDADFLTGVVKGHDALTQLLDIPVLVSQHFNSAAKTQEKKNKNWSESKSGLQAVVDTETDLQRLVSFCVDEQEYAFDLMEVEEIVRIPEHLTRVPAVDNHVLGLIDLRGRLLPLISLRLLFGFEQTDLSENHRILVIAWRHPGGKRDVVGLVVDAVKEVLHVNEEVKGSVPALLLEQHESTEITGICRLENGKRLVSVLTAEFLFKDASVRQALSEQGDEREVDLMTGETRAADEDDDQIEQLVVFHLGGQEYGVSIDYVQEITRIPEQLERVPRTPDFVEGMVNMRGIVLPVLDMRTRFEMEKLNRSEGQRIIVLNLSGTRTGYIVDSVSEVLRLPKSRIEESPDLSDDQSRMMGRIVNLKEEKRMIQVLTTEALLNEEEINQINNTEA